MIFRIIGGVLVCLSCGLIGLYMGSKAGARVQKLLEFKRTLLMLKSEIEFAIYTLPQAFNNISGRTVPPFSTFYAQIGHEVANKEMSLDTAWTAGLKNLSTTQLIREDFEMMDGLGKALGNMDVQIQLRAIDMTVNIIENTVVGLNAENAKKAGMYRGLGILGGLLITVILL